MDPQVKSEDPELIPSSATEPTSKGKSKNREKDISRETANKRRCVSTACIACRRRKSKCDGNLPKCAACASVYLTECEYAPHTDHRRKGVYKKDVDSLKTKSSALQVLISAILNAEEEDVAELVRQIRTSDNLEDLANNIEAREKGLIDDGPDSPLINDASAEVPQFEAELSGKMGDLWLDGSVKFIGGTSNLIWMPDNLEQRTMGSSPSSMADIVKTKEEAIMSWTKVTQDKDLILHFMNMYFCWHYAYFTTLSKELFYRDFLTGTTSQYCSSLLVNVMLALGCHFSSKPAARALRDDSSTTGDHFFKEAKRLLYEDDEFANAKLCTVQALALMSVREAGCGRESKGWVYSGMSFRMAFDLGLNLDAQPFNEMSRLSDEDVDARRITFWGCFLFDKCWSNYLGRQPQLQISSVTVKKPEVFPSEDSEMWSPYTDSGIIQANAQPARTRAVAIQISRLAEISGDLLVSFYNPQSFDKPSSKPAELKKLSDIHTRLEAWKKELSPELDIKETQLPQILLMHMFHQLLYIHLYRPFLKYTRATSPLPSHISPRKFCTQAAGSISKLFRLYKRTHGLRQICNIAIYIAHTACTIHILNLPDKNAKRDIVHGVKHLEEMGECWTQARRTMRILNLCAERWRIELPEEAEAAFARARLRWGLLMSSPSVQSSPGSLQNLLRQFSPQAASDLLSQNMRLQQEHQNYAQQVPFTLGTMAQMQPAVSAAMTPSPPSMTDRRHSPGNMSLPPQTSSQFGQASTNLRASTQMNAEPQGAPDVHQAWITSGAGTSTTRSASDPGAYVTKPVTEGSGLPEEPQDWWFKDQSQLALGFDNWTAPTQDWFGFDSSHTHPEMGNPAPMMESAQFGFGAANAGTGYGPLTNNAFTKNAMSQNAMSQNAMSATSGVGNQRNAYDEEVFY